ncbi:MAG: hypothetical protein U0470_00890 [Anaerolineae bacterium]
MDEPPGLLGDRRRQLGIAVPEGVDGDARVEVQVATPSMSNSQAPSPWLTTSGGRA